MRRNLYAEIKQFDDAIELTKQPGTFPHNNK